MTALNSKIQRQLLTTRDPDDGKVELADWLFVEYDFADGSGQIEIPASAADPVYLLDIHHITLTVADGTDITTAVVDIGDGTTADKYMADGNILTPAGLVNRATKTAKLTANAVVKATVDAQDSNPAPITCTAGKGLLVLKVLHAA